MPNSDRLAWGMWRCLASFSVRHIDTLPFLQVESAWAERKGRHRLAKVSNLSEASWSV